jgi:hypothetical protein
MMLSTVWLIAALVFWMYGHPFTAAMLALPWFVHRRWERP